jgi:hypothetical protein
MQVQRVQCTVERVRKSTRKAWDLLTASPSLRPHPSRGPGARHPVPRRMNLATCAQWQRSASVCLLAKQQLNKTDRWAGATLIIAVSQYVACVIIPRCATPTMHAHYEVGAPRPMAMGTSPCGLIGCTSTAARCPHDIASMLVFVCTCLTQAELRASARGCDCGRR